MTNSLQNEKEILQSKIVHDRYEEGPEVENRKDYNGLGASTLH